MGKERVHHEARTGRIVPHQVDGHLMPPGALQQVGEGGDFPAGAMAKHGDLEVLQVILRAGPRENPFSETPFAASHAFETRRSSAKFAATPAAGMISKTYPSRPAFESA